MDRVLTPKALAAVVVQASHGQVDGRSSYPARLVEAMKIAMFAISSSVMSRRAWVLLASSSWNCSQVIPDALARDSKKRLLDPTDSGIACGRRPTTRMP
jgi:hypothetical protein